MTKCAIFLSGKGSNFVNIIEKIKGNSPNSIRLGLEAYERITKSDGEHQYLMEMLQKTIMSKDAQEGINAFKEKRNPVGLASK